MPIPRDDSPFIEAITRHQPSLRAFCRAHITLSSDADDTLQKTNLKLWEKRADWDPETPFLAWAFTIARFTILSHFRDSKRDRLIFDEDVADSLVTPFLKKLDDYPERVEALQHCMEFLTDAKRKVLRQHYHERLPLKDIATSSGKSLSAIKVGLHRIRKELSLCIRHRLRDAH